MCGFTGIITSRSVAGEIRFQVDEMARSLSHRGPDDSGIWVSGDAGVGLGFRRLAVLDISAEGHQPMLSTSARYVIVFNGEIYNFVELRSELRAHDHTFRGHSDTEVMLAGFEQWGIEQAVSRFRGMFAFAVWDCREHILYLVRDRIGIKPLYYGWAGESFIFGSELKALVSHPKFVRQIDRDALGLYLQFQYIPAPYSIFENSYKLSPGHILAVNVRDGRAALGHSFCYWSAKTVYEHGSTVPFRGSENEAIEELDHILREAVRLRLISDVPVGAFLSGGIDSSLVVSLMQAESSSSVKTFTIGFREDAYNEARYAKAVASHLGTEHTEAYISSDEVRAVIPKLARMYDEPFGDSSQLPTYLVSALARRSVTVALSGDGGDELFGGYTRYVRAVALWEAISRIPRPVGILAGTLTRQFSSNVLERAIDIVGYALPRRFRLRKRGDSIHLFGDILANTRRERLYELLISHWIKPSAVVMGSESMRTIFDTPSEWPRLQEFSGDMMFWDLMTYLPDDILVKLDRASMAVGLEARVPLLDHKVVEFAARLPSNMKLRNGSSKWALRHVLYRYLPKELVNRPKMGFGVPVGEWLRGPLREWAEDLLDESRLRREGFLHSGPIRKLWAEHLSGRTNWQYHLWDVLMFQAWQECWIS
jgi:asparagine synthase (glutamine-hydrolysing)